MIFFLSAFDLSGVKRKEEDAGEPMVAGAMPAGAVVTGDTLPQQGVMPMNAGAMAGGNVAAAGGSPSIVVVQGGAPVQAGAPVSPVQSVADPVNNAPVTPEMEEATTAYLEQLKAMTEMLSRCTEQAQTISQDTEQMNLLSKNLAGINAIYEMQLRSVSTQIGTIDQVHEQTRRMARQIENSRSVCPYVAGYDFKIKKNNYELWITDTAPKDDKPYVYRSYGIAGTQRLLGCVAWLYPCG